MVRYRDNIVPRKALSIHSYWLRCHFLVSRYTDRSECVGFLGIHCVAVVSLRCGSE